MSNLLKTLNKNKNENEKFNPDVGNLYNQTTQLRNTTKYEHTNEGYKTIINNKVPLIVKSQEDLKITYEKSNEKDRLIVLKKINELENDRLNEKKNHEKQIDHSKKLDELIKIKRKELTETNYQASTHGELKQIQIKQNDKTQKEKERFNNIVSSINNILNN
jgi:hypothetical protein